MRRAHFTVVVFSGIFGFDLKMAAHSQGEGTNAKPFAMRFNRRDHIVVNRWAGGICHDDVVRDAIAHEAEELQFSRPVKAARHGQKYQNRASYPKGYWPGTAGLQVRSI